MVGASSKIGLVLVLVRLLSFHCSSESTTGTVLQHNVQGGSLLLCACWTVVIERVALLGVG
jgi:hypothetical protein